VSLDQRDNDPAGHRRQPAQIVRSVAFESAAMGVIASAVGPGVGVLMSFGLRALLSAVGLEVPSGSIVIAPSTVITAFVVCTAITVISALWPAVLSSQVRPIAALRDVAIDVRARRWPAPGPAWPSLALAWRRSQPASWVSVRN
jgi:predicted lysophospholipase L1 biosynthesis ABC-type transport system permease subunit